MNIPKMPKLPPAPVIISDEELVSRAKNGSTASLEELFRRYENQALQVARNIVPQLYEDVVQDAYLKVMSAIATCQGNFASWFLMIVRNHAITQYRKEKRFDYLEDMEYKAETLAAEDNYSDIDFTDNQDFLIKNLREAIMNLSPSQIEVIAGLLAESHINDRSCGLLKRTALRINRSEGAVRNALFQIRKHLQTANGLDVIEQILTHQNRETILNTVFTPLQIRHN